jgi:hypothetical protein
VWTTFCTDPGHNRYSNHSSKDCPLNRRAERESVKMTSSTQLQGNAGRTSVTTFLNDIQLPQNETTCKNNRKVEVSFILETDHLLLMLTFNKADANNSRFIRWLLIIQEFAPTKVNHILTKKNNFADALSRKPEFNEHCATLNNR